MQILSWNVAGWTPTYHLICQHFGSLENFLNLHGCDVFCVQETKVSEAKAKDISGRQEAFRQGLEVHGTDTDSKQNDQWTSFFAFNRSKSGRKSGFNGVATFVKTSKYKVFAATQKVFNDAELDDEGRALFVDFGTFRLLNIYAPFANSPEVSPQKTALKLKFMQKLEARYFRTASTFKSGGGDGFFDPENYTILVGDFNISYRKEDVKLARRLLKIKTNTGEIIDGVPPMSDAAQVLPNCRLEAELDPDGGHSGDEAEARNLKELEKGSSSTTSSFIATNTHATPASASSASSSFAKTASAVAVPPPKTTGSKAPGREDQSQSVGGSKSRAQPKISSFFSSSFRNVGETTSQTGDLKPSSSATEESDKGNPATGSSDHSYITLAGAALQTGHSMALFRDCGLPRHLRFEEQAVIWLHKFLKRKVVDVWDFVRNRFTCWNQFTSERVESNNGSRIDYFLMSHPMFAKYLELERSRTGAAPSSSGTIPGAAANDEVVDLESSDDGVREVAAAPSENNATSASLSAAEFGKIVFPPPQPTQTGSSRVSASSSRVPPVGSILRRVGYLEPEEVAILSANMGSSSSATRSSDKGGSETEALRQLYQRWTTGGRTAIAGEADHQTQPPIPLPMAGYFRRAPTQETNARGQICGPFNEEQAGFFGTTCFGGWNPANRFGQAAMQDAHGGQKDDMRLNNSQFFHHLPSLRSLTCPGGGGGDFIPGGGHVPSPHSVNILEFAPRETSTSEARFSRKRHVANHVYTPPSYSDHIAISLLVPDEVLEALPVKPCGLPAGQTKDTHVWRGKTKSMLSFMGGGGKQEVLPLPSSKISSGEGDTKRRRL